MVAIYIYLDFTLIYAEYTGTQRRFNYNRGDYEDARQELQEVPITANGSVQQMWDTIKDRVIGLRNDHPS